MNNHSLTAIPTSRYDAFLFASVCEEASGMPLSVLSALARMNVDPWEEAARLAAMPKEVAEKTLAAAFDLVSTSTGKRRETEAVAARLVQLLPRWDGDARAAATEIAGSRTGRLAHPVILICFVIALSLITARHHQTAADAGASASLASSVSRSEIPAANSVLTDASDKSR